MSNDNVKTATIGALKAQGDLVTRIAALRDARVFESVTLHTNADGNVTRTTIAADEDAKATCLTTITSHWCALQERANTVRFEWIDQNSGMIRLDAKGKQTLAYSVAVGTDAKDLGTVFKGSPKDLGTMRGQVARIRDDHSSYRARTFNRWQAMSNEGTRQRSEPKALAAFIASHVDAVTKRCRKEKVELNELLETVTRSIRAAYSK